jgi:hypothetical protein
VTNYLDLGGNRIATLDLLIPYLGIPVVDIELALAPAPGSLSGQQTLTIGNLSFVTTSVRGGDFAGEAKIRAVAGFGAWLQNIAPQGYQNPSGVMASTVLQDAASTVGEQIAVLADLNVGNFWSREGSNDPNSPVPAARVLRSLCPLWWVDPATGITQAYCTGGNVRPSTAIQSDFEVIDWNPGTGLLKITTEDPASWQPGNTFSNVFMGGATVTISQTRIVCKGDGDMSLHVLQTP